MATGFLWPGVSSEHRVQRLLQGPESMDELAAGDSEGREDLEGPASLSSGDHCFRQSVVTCLIRLSQFAQAR